MSQKLLLLIVILSLSPFSFSQKPEEKKDGKPDEKTAKIRTQAVAFMRDAMAEANNLRSLENRISFAPELAGLMWYHDEKEAKLLFAGVINDFRELLVRYDGQMGAIGMGSNDGDYNGGFLDDLSDKSRITRKFSMAMAVRQQIALSLGEHDPETALNFYYESKSAISNADFRKQMDSRDAYFENRLVMMAVNAKSPKAVQLAVRSLEKGFNSQHVELLRKIAEKDPDKGAEFGAAILSKIKSDSLDTDDFYAASALLSFGDRNLTETRTESKKSVYSQADLREIADIFGQAILNAKTPEAALGMQFIASIEKYAPGRAAQIRSKSGRAGGNTNASYASNRVMHTSGVGMAPPPMVSAEFTNSNSNVSAARYTGRAERENAEEKMMKDVMSLSEKELPKDERANIIARARKIIAETPGREKKIASLSLLGTQVAASGDKELAAEIMKDAASFVNPNPKNYQDFMFTWMLATGYASADPARAFPLLEDTISRANDTISAFVKVAEFIDITGEIVDDGELQVGAFGSSMIRGLTGELGIADSTIKILAHFDFEKTADLANKFDRPEVRMLAKMMVLRAVLEEKKPASQDIDLGL